MTPADIARLRTKVADSQTAPWPVAAVRAKAALAAAMEAHGEALLDLAQRALELPPDRPVGQLCADAEYGRGRRQRQAGYARRHEAKRKQSAALTKAREAVLEVLLLANEARSILGGSELVLRFNNSDDVKAFHGAWGSYTIAVRDAALSDLAQADAELLDAAE